MLLIITLFHLLVFCDFVGGLIESERSEKGRKRWALIVTLAGQLKLSQYFEWSCRSVGYSQDIFDMLVFHESNPLLQSITCASNVKFIDVGKDGMAKLVVPTIMSQSTDWKFGSHEESSARIDVMAKVIEYVPRYLIEIKPLMGSMFGKWLKDYSHWSYTDPDIIWGNMSDWVDRSDADNFDILSIAKIFDSARLFIRGQFALHRNVDRVNTLWHKLPYFRPDSFIARLDNAVHMMDASGSADEVFNSNFNSAEGLYSQVVFRANVSVKISGRGFDDFVSDPVIFFRGRLVRSKYEAIVDTLRDLVEQTRYPSVHSSPAVVAKRVDSYFHKQACRMQWIPHQVRYCLARRRADSTLRLLRLGESFSYGLAPSSSPASIIADGDNPKADGVPRRVWYANDERLARRQVRTVAAFFHFRHWDDYGSSGTVTQWGDARESWRTYCMILHLRPNDHKMAYETCKAVVTRLVEGK